MAGYDGYSMSNNARAAYQSGSRPLSQWRRDEFVEEVNWFFDCEVSAIMGSYKRFLKWESWHHTSKFYNKTNFYEVDFEAVEWAIRDGVIKTVAPVELAESKEQAPYDYIAEQAERHGDWIKRGREMEAAEKVIITRENGEQLAVCLITEKQPILFNLLLQQLENPALEVDHIGYVAVEGKGIKADIKLKGAEHENAF